MVTCVAVIAVSDFVLWRWRGPPFVILALLDEPAHAATGLVALGAVGVIFEVPIVLAVLAGSVVIDLDHIPDQLGSDFLLVGHGIHTRPYTHSLATVVVLAAVALLVGGNARKLMLVAALALVMHFFRDIAEPRGSGAPLLWPLSDRVYTLGYGWYAGGVVLLATIALWRRTRHPTLRHTHAIDR
ncbi:MAG: metal-dependent hydrolase [Solirubrobacteraceae bacterium]